VAIAIEPNDSEVDAFYQDLKVIDCDSHLTERPDIWSSRVSEKWRDRVPVQHTTDGVTSWFLDGERWASTGGNTIAAGRRKIFGTLAVQPFDAIDPAAWNVTDRLRLLDEMGMYAQILYPNGIGFASNHVFAIDDLAQRQVVLELFNDYYSDLQEESGGRLLPQGLLPIWDMKLTVAEMTRLLNRGMRGFTLSDRPELLGLPELDDPYFAPMWDMFNESGAVANFHIAAGRTKEEFEGTNQLAAKGRAAPAGRTPETAKLVWSSFGPMRSLAVRSSQGFMSNVRIIANLCMSDLFDRYPNLKIVSAESGLGWIPFLLEALEFELDEVVMASDERNYQQRRPTEYFRDHLYVTFWFERHAPMTSIEAVGVENVLIETDVPHPTCLYPGAREHFAEVLSGWSPYIRRRVLQDNAAELYKIPLESAGR